MSMRQVFWGLIFAVIVICLSATMCSKRPSGVGMKLTSPSFQHGAKIPKVHTCEGAGYSPELVWQGLPANTKSLALIMDDPDAPHGVFIHWVAWNIDPKSNKLIENLPSGKVNEGTNSLNKKGYFGPCPPQGKPHRYFFKLYALDTKLNLPDGTTKQDLLKAISGHVVAEAELMGQYESTK